MNSTEPIGIFDSGIGGLTVAKAIKEVLPHERIIYFGDTAHLPYGDKSTAAIQAYSVRIADFLIKKGCKAIVIACNTASSAAYDLVREYAGNRIKVFDVINPTVDFIRENFSNKRVGLIGTKQTVNSGVYAAKVASTNKSIELCPLATPMLVPMIEEGMLDEQISTGIIDKYLSDSSLTNIDALILGCTHYPLIKAQIRNFYKKGGKQVDVIDSAQTVARSLKAFLEYNQLLSKSKPTEDRFYVSDFTDSFERTTKIFFGEEVHLEREPIWNEFN